jgi:hypothetical protein
MTEIGERKSSPLDYVAIVVAGTSFALIAAGALAAQALSDLRGVDGTERFRLLAQAASPSVAAFALLAVAIAVYGRRHTDGWAGEQVAATPALGIGAGVAFVTALLALNGVVVDLSQEGPNALYRLGNVIGRMATLALCGLALWLAATAPARRESPPPAMPPPSPPDAPDPSSPA